MSEATRFKIKTFGRKASRMRPAERQALLMYLESIRVPDDHVITPEETFGQRGPLFVEIGFGKGEFLYNLATRHPEANILGIEVFITGVAKLLRRMCHYDNSRSPEPNNIRVLIKEAHSALRENFLPNSIDRVFILFPDPWPKKRHHKRRLIKPEFVSLLKEKLNPSGSVLIATDHEGYLEAIREAFKGGGFKEKDSSEPMVLETKYARKAISEGRRVYQFEYVPVCSN